ncbi:MAG: alanine--tRNA ligase [Myxococcota bacterium]
MSLRGAPSSSSALRQRFLSYFAEHGHTVVKSAPLIPANDPTLMFTNAGMVQFKDVFVGSESRSYTRAASSQKCMRVSGKHNDLEEVGRTARHHTFFEMLGNFSFGDYFKEEAIALAWRFLTEEVSLDPQRLWITVFGGEQGIAADREARQIWKSVTGLGDERILDMGLKDNFWAMGDTGPCGPCTEIHYDLNPHATPTLSDFESGRVVEIWNNVFMQFNRQADGTLEPLPKPAVDTGMGLERLAAIVQGEASNYHSDLFAPLLAEITTLADKTYQRGDSEDDVSMRVIADHARATAFLVADGIKPSNEGRGYVMRRIMRRAIRHGKRLGFTDIFFDRICLKVVDTMGEAYGELREARSLIEKVVALEEAGFRRTLDTGMAILMSEVEQASQAKRTTLSGETAFKLYDTYGFPRDLTDVIAAEHGLVVDSAAFDRQMSLQKERSRGGSAGEAAVATVYKALRERLGETRFVGYDNESLPLSERQGAWRNQHIDGADYLQVQTTIVAIVYRGEVVDKIDATDDPSQVEVVLDSTPFYGESGGQVGDRGMIVAEDGLKLEVIASQKPLENFTVCQGRVLAGELKQGQQVWAGYVPEIRKLTRAHHSATHLMQAALRKVLGEHVTQAGSLVDAEHLRFDFSHFEAPTREQLRAIEDDVNRRIKANDTVTTDILAFDEAKKRGALALFGEKYGDTVRVLSMGDSVEFCGGTHVNCTGDIGLLLITREEAIAAGVRRIEAEVGSAAVRTGKQTRQQLQQVAELLAGRFQKAESSHALVQAIAGAARSYEHLCQKTNSSAQWPTSVTVPPWSEPPTLASLRALRDTWQGLVRLSNARGNDVLEMVERLDVADDAGLLRSYAQLMHNNRLLERMLAEQKTSKLSGHVETLLEGMETVNGISLVAAKIDGVEGKALRQLADQLRSRFNSGILCLCATQDDKVALLISVSTDLTARFKAGELIKTLAPVIGGRGGGKPELAQAGGNNPQAIDTLFEDLRTLLKS